MNWHVFVNILNSVPQEAWTAGISAIFLSPFMLGVKKYFDVHHEALMMFYVIGGSFITAAIAYVQATPSFAPWLIIPLQGLITFALSQPVYYLAIKPLKRQFMNMLGDADKLNEAKRAAAVTK